MMPDMSGLTLLETLRKRFSVADMPVIMVTAKQQSGDVVEALRLGANDYVTKPIDFPVLLARVQTHISLKRLSELKDEFMRIASHDLKNPLTEVLGTAGLVEMLVPPGTPMPENVYGMLGNIKRGARKIQTIIEDFLEFQALEDGVLKLSSEPVDLNALVCDVADAFQAQARAKETTIELELPVGLPSVLGDRWRLMQVVQNLLDNALKFSPRGTTLRLRTHKDDARVRVEVTDAGPGLTDDDFAKLFVKYAKLSNLPTGGEKSSGLGLSICKQLIDSHGGRIGAENNPSGGATFWFELPMQTSAETQADTTSQQLST
jgi:signal transduction histidine kinase